MNYRIFKPYAGIKDTLQSYSIQCPSCLTEADQVFEKKGILGCRNCLKV